MIIRTATIVLAAALALAGCGSSGSPVDTKYVEVAAEPVYIEVQVPAEPVYIEVEVPAEPVYIFAAQPPDLYWADVHREEWRVDVQSQDRRPTIWAVYEKTLTFTELEGLEYSVLFDEEEAPGAITSPWVVTSEIPGWLDNSNVCTLPKIRVRACNAEGECADSVTADWRASAEYGYDGPLVCP